VSRLNVSLDSVSLDYVKDIDLRAQGLLEATFVNDSVYGSAGPFGVIWKVSKTEGESFYFAQVGFTKELHSCRCYGMLLFLILAYSADMCSVTVCWMWCSIAVLSLFLLLQHLPFHFLPMEVGPLYRMGSNTLSIRQFQCLPGVNLSYALVNAVGVSEFSEPQEQCFYGEWGRDDWEVCVQSTKCKHANSDSLCPSHHVSR